MSQKLVLRISAVVSAISGAVILFTTIYPIVSYENKAAVKYPLLLNPVVESQTKGTNTQGETQSSVDYTDPKNWFIGADYDISLKPKVAYYNISIPKLDINDATVEVGGEDLGKSLIQYPGTAAIGKPGNAVIFGHSILPQFYNPKSYLAIFSLLPTLEKGDDIEVKYDGVTYKYKVEAMFEVLPTDLQVLDQQTDSSYLTLVTCVPPGHPLKPRRLIVRAKIISYNKGLELPNNENTGN
ncbi:sortase [Candidatus Woesebacteria bacterium]|nr:sortase [Candidatus Woesebacteria bacterium]